MINNATVIAFVALFYAAMFQSWKAALIGAAVALVCCAAFDVAIYLLRRLTERT